jgi:hypothetical protein
MRQKCNRAILLVGSLLILGACLHFAKKTLKLIIISKFYNNYYFKFILIE